MPQERSARDHTVMLVNLDKSVALNAGSHCAIRDRGRTVGSGVITEIIE